MEPKNPGTQFTTPPGFHTNRFFTPQFPPPPPPPPAAAAPYLPPKPHKRPHDDANTDVHNSKIFKIRKIVKEMRPHFIEVLRTPDFRNCSAAQEIRQRMKHMLELYQQMAEEISNSKCKTAQENPTLNGFTQYSSEKLHNVRKDSLADRFGARLSGKLNSGDGKKHLNYIIGGSIVGWNFITFTGGAPVYYGVTKETYRTANPTSRRK